MRTVNKMLMKLLGGGGAGVSLLPLDLDFGELEDGALPSSLLGTTWQISDGKAVNNPSLGAELLTDPSLEASYSSGRCVTLTASGSPTLAESADAHSGSKAQQFTGVAVANAVSWAAAAGVAGQWRQFGVWSKRAAGTAGNVGVMVFQSNAQPADSTFLPIVSSEYTRILLSYISTTTDNQFRYAARQTAAGNPSDTVISDDGSNKVIDYETLFALLPETQSDVVVKIQPDALIDGTHFGLVVRADAQENPSNCIFILGVQHSTSTIMRVSVIKKIGSTYARVLNETTVTKVVDAWLEVRASGNTVQVFYNNTQRGGDLTISDTELIDNKYHGMFSAGGNQVKRFLASAN